MVGEFWAEDNLIYKYFELKNWEFKGFREKKFDGNQIFLILKIKGFNKLKKKLGDQNRTQSKQEEKNEIKPWK